MCRFPRGKRLRHRACNMASGEFISFANIHQNGLVVAVQEDHATPKPARRFGLEAFAGWAGRRPRRLADRPGIPISGADEAGRRPDLKVPFTSRFVTIALQTGFECRLTSPTVSEPSLFARHCVPLEPLPSQ